MLSKFICDRSWHFLLHSFIPVIYLLFFLPEALWRCSFHSPSRFVRIVFFFLLIHLTGVSCFFFFKFFFILSSLASLFNRSAVRFWSSLFLVYLVSTRVISIPSCPLYSSFIALQPPRFTWCSLFLFSTGVLSYSFWSVKLLFHILQPTKVLAMFLVPLAERSVLNFVHLRCVISSSFATSQGSLVSLICQRSN